MSEKTAMSEVLLSTTSPGGNTNIRQFDIKGNQLVQAERSEGDRPHEVGYDVSSCSDRKCSNVVSGQERGKVG